ncbi:MAG TPA: hypothetical protein VF540_04515 [Segetibacter sp.]
MDGKILFSETQKFNQWWLWLILLSYITMLSVVLIVIIRQKHLSNLIRKTVLVFTSLLILIPTIIFLSFRLETEIRRGGVYVKFFPFHTTFKEYKWKNVSKSYVRQYNPIDEYGGWGFREGASGKAFNVSGYQGLQLEFYDHDKMLIGTNKPKELTETLMKIAQLKQ